MKATLTLPRNIAASRGACRMIAAAFGAALVFASPSPTRAEPDRVLDAGDSATVNRRISMGVGKTIVVDLLRDAAEVIVGNPKVANAVVRTSRKLYLIGQEAGQSSIVALDHDGRQIANLEVSVGRDVGSLGALLKAALPRTEIVARTINDTVILTGFVQSAGEAQRAVDIAKGFAVKSGAAQSSSDASVVNALNVRGQEQVMLKVTVAEVQRRVIKQLGFSTDTGGETLLKGNWGKFINENPFAINSALTSTAAVFNGPNSTTATLKAFERNSVSRVLAEPTLTAVSGESAKMLVGGEIAVPGNSSCYFGTNGATACTPSINFKPYGVSLAFTPVVLAEGRIQMHLQTEVTEVDPTATYTYSNVAVPGFKTRKNETTIELPSGGSIATAGLLTQKSAQAINGLPGLLNMPILGALFRSRDYQREETELLIVVTPYIARSVSSQEIARPDDGFVDATDPQGWLLGRMNRIYSSKSNPRIQQQFKGRVGFIND
jgi:pilus assembly protein CpaC